ncbi:heparinase II/III family protein [Marinobacter maritimus]|uniref:heparinase II/III family protein n=1 Tax=Marinobacter maritimus TaxID=277961 RepID=UPI0011A025BA|nr:heparinase II/III-family protein [Marinobacter maritimus]
MASFISKIKTVRRLGALNVFRALSFRLGVQLGVNRVRHLKASAPVGRFFSRTEWPVNSWDEFRYFPLAFGHVEVSREGVPDWNKSVLTGKCFPDCQKPWYAIRDFTNDVGDIKGIWELSRFDWVLGFAREGQAGHTEALEKLQSWLESWVQENPPYYGPNWKCGQEASIRVMHLAMAAIVLGQVYRPEKALLELVEIHLKRIAPTIQYAIAQDNNHGTSEAAALFIGGSWLASHGISQGRGWELKGRKWLENRASRLIERDGSFSQYSVNYHRVMLDTFSMVEVWRKTLQLPEFSRHWYTKAKAATEWLMALLQPGGDVPNLGANDGARLLPLAAVDYRDFRPSAQLANVLFCGQRAVSEPGEWDVPLRLLLGVDLPEPVAEIPGSVQFDDGGYAIMRKNHCFALFRYPRFRFRPGQADALHLDVWLGSRNILRDGGSYSYNTEEPLQSYFPGVESHNTIQFDGRDQMPRLSRFLFGEWLKTSRFRPLAESSEGLSVLAGYRDYKGAMHTRKVLLGTDKLIVQDDIDGFSKNAVLRWRLEPGKWELSGSTAKNENVAIAITSTTEIVRCEIVDGYESRYYGRKTTLPVLEIEVADAGCLSTEITWNAI